MSDELIVDRAFEGLAAELDISVSDFDAIIQEEGISRADVVLEAYPSGPTAEAAAALGGRFDGPAGVSTPGGGVEGMIHRIAQAAASANLELDALLVLPLPPPVKLAAGAAIYERFIASAFGRR
jgi:hypothetical protein